MSILQLFQAGKKIRCLSLLQQKSLHLFASLNIKDSSLITECDESTKDFGWFMDRVLQIEVNEVSGDDAVTYYVADYWKRCVSEKKVYLFHRSAD